VSATFVRAVAPVSIALVAMLSGCGDKQIPAAELGQQLFSDRGISTSRLNSFSCSTCHVVEPGLPLVIAARYDAGFNLAGTASRSLWWGGHSTRLIDAVNVCLEEFMGGRRLDPEEPRARQLLEYLWAASPEPSAPPAPLTIVREPTDLATLTGDPDRGALIYLAGCQRCHGAAHSGLGRLDTRTPVVPEDTQRMFTDPKVARHVVVEKVRHGRFFQIGGVMPFYPAESMSDAALADVLAYLGL
jgi:thiosulfate dehydrogenase